jgi:hypothetical protein
MALFTKWRTERELKRKAEQYVRTLMVEPSADESAWLAHIATRDDIDHARWELRYARRALGLLVAQRDALDDRTGSLVAHTLDEAFARDSNIATNMLDVAERQFNARLSAYRDVLNVRGGAPVSTRLGQTLLAFAGGAFRHVDEHVLRGGTLLASYVEEANSALRDAFGLASLPENTPPSALLPGTK